MDGGRSLWLAIVAAIVVMATIGALMLFRQTRDPDKPDPAAAARTASAEPIVAEEFREPASAPVELEAVPVRKKDAAVTVRVMSLDGRPLPGLRVAIRGIDQEQPPDSEVTDAAGKARFENVPSTPDWQIGVAGPRVLEVRRVDAVPGGELELRLDLRTLRFRFLTPERELVSPQVLLSQNMTWPAGLQETSPADRRYWVRWLALPVRVEMLAPRDGVLVLENAAASWIATLILDPEWVCLDPKDDDLDTGTTSRIPIDAERRERDIVVARRVQIRGRIVARDTGLALPGGGVECEVAATGSTAKISVGIRPDGTFLVMPKAAVIQGITIAVREAAGARRGTFEIREAITGEKDLGDLFVDGRRTIRLHVFDEQRRPVADAAATILGGDAHGSVFRGAPDGIVEISGPAAEIHCEIAALGYEPARKTFGPADLVGEVTLRAAHVLRIEVRSWPARGVQGVTVQVTSSSAIFTESGAQPVDDGEPGTAAFAPAAGFLPAPGSVASGASSYVRASSRTDGGVAVSFAPATDGSVVLNAWNPEAALSVALADGCGNTTEAIDVPARDDSEPARRVVVLELPNLTQVSGRIVDAKGAPLLGARVRFEMGTNTRPLPVKAGGYVTPIFFRRKLKLHAKAEGFATTTVEIDPDAPIVERPITLSPSGDR